MDRLGSPLQLLAYMGVAIMILVNPTTTTMIGFLASELSTLTSYGTNGKNPKFTLILTGQVSPHLMQVDPMRTWRISKSASESLTPRIQALTGGRDTTSVVISQVP